MIGATAALQQGRRNEEGRFSRIARVTGLILVLASGIAKAADTPDAWVTMKTKVSLITTEGVDTHDLNVDLLEVVPSVQRATVERSDEEIKKGVVLLSGKTKSTAAHLESVEVANAVRGVRHVSTEVEVVPAS